MTAVVDTVNSLAMSLLGPNSPVPWWAWTAFLLMLVWAIVLPERGDN
jgi:hypothetical protein